MKIDLEDKCTCGHMASFHESEQTTYNLIPNQEPVTVVSKVYGNCRYDKSVVPTNDPTATSGAGWDYTNFGRYCYCTVFKMDNLRYLERRSQ